MKRNTIPMCVKNAITKLELSLGLAKYDMGTVLINGQARVMTASRGIKRG